MEFENILLDESNDYLKYVKIKEESIIERISNE